MKWSSDPVINYKNRSTNTKELNLHSTYANFRCFHHTHRSSTLQLMETSHCPCIVFMKMDDHSIQFLLSQLVQDFYNKIPRDPTAFLSSNRRNQGSWHFGTVIAFPLIPRFSTEHILRDHVREPATQCHINSKKKGSQMLPYYWTMYYQRRR